MPNNNPIQVRINSIVFMNIRIMWIAWIRAHNEFKISDEHVDDSLDKLSIAHFLVTWRRHVSNAFLDVNCPSFHLSHFISIDLNGQWNKEIRRLKSAILSVMLRHIQKRLNTQTIWKYGRWNIVCTVRRRPISKHIPTLYMISTTNMIRTSWQKKKWIVLNNNTTQRNMRNEEKTLKSKQQTVNGTNNWRLISIKPSQHVHIH